MGQLAQPCHNQRIEPIERCNPTDTVAPKLHGCLVPPVDDKDHDKTADYKKLIDTRLLNFKLDPQAVSSAALHPTNTMLNDHHHGRDPSIPLAGNRRTSILSNYLVEGTFAASRLV